MNRHLSHFIRMIFKDSHLSERKCREINYALLLGGKLTPRQNRYIYSDELLSCVAELNGATISCLEIPESL